jgi:hypothetical protein
LAITLKEMEKEYPRNLVVIEKDWKRREKSV